MLEFQLLSCLSILVRITPWAELFDGRPVLHLGVRSLLPCCSRGNMNFSPIYCCDI